MCFYPSVSIVKDDVFFLCIDEYNWLALSLFQINPTGFELQNIIRLCEVRSGLDRDQLGNGYIWPFEVSFLMLSCF